MNQNLRKSGFAAMAIILAIAGFAQTSKNVLFIGNSYIYTNDLPSIVEAIADSMGDTLTYDQSTPGGYTFESHVSNATTLSKIEEGNWDFVVLQEQSQIPSFPLGQVETDCFPFAAELCALVNQSNACAENLFFMTWGRENGDSQNCANWPPVCTYEGMDDLLSERYLMMAEQNDAAVSPVGAVWRYIRENNDQIELYSADESHPSLAGSYAAAVCFYTAIFRKDPENIMFNEGVSESDASFIRTAVKSVVYDHFEDWFIGGNDPVAAVEWTEISGLTYQFVNVSQNAESVQIAFQENDWIDWTENEISHTFPGIGAYTIAVIATSCGVSDTTYYELMVGPVGINELEASFRLFPNPASESFRIMFDPGRGETISLEIRDLEGRVLRQISPSRQQSLEISIVDLPAGMYTVCCISTDGVVSRKMVIMR